jgi:hypothetical protein
LRAAEVAAQLLVVLVELVEQAGNILYLVHQHIMLEEEEALVLATTAVLAALGEAATEANTLLHLYPEQLIQGEAAAAIGTAQGPVMAALAW